MLELTATAARFADLAAQLQAAVDHAHHIAEQADDEFDAIVTSVAGEADDDQRSRIRDAVAIMLGYTAIDHLIAQLT